MNLTERERGPQREPAKPAVSVARPAETPWAGPLFVAVVRDDWRSGSRQRPTSGTRPAAAVAIAVPTIAFVATESDTGNALGEPMQSSAASTPRHRLATEAVTAPVAGLAAEIVRKRQPRSTSEARPWLLLRSRVGYVALDDCRAKSDNQMTMVEISATDASKKFADMLDAVEHRGESFTVVRRGRAIASITPARRTSLGELRRFLHEHPPDDAWRDELAELRRSVGPAPTRDPWSE